MRKLVEEDAKVGEAAGGRVGDLPEYFEGDIGIRSDQYRDKRKDNITETVEQDQKTEIPPTFGVSVGLRVVWAGGKNSLVEKIWPGGNVPVVISNRSNLKSYGFAFYHTHLFNITN